LGAQRRDQEAREIEQLQAHPAVQEVLQHFPDARIAEVRSTAQGTDDEENGEAPEDEFKNDGTN
jgi:predicted 3-demethylubiquinone-9 3-methyltransferase (glyoxalase superfamily)